MKPVARIVFCADLLRETCVPCAGPIKAKIYGFHGLLGWQVGAATGLPVRVIDRFPDDTFFKSNGCDVTLADWAKLSERDACHADGVACVEKLLGNSLVIGYELPGILVGVLDGLGIPYVDMVIHPVRFLEDIFLAFRTNSAAVYERLLRRRQSDDYYRLNAGQWRCRAAMTLRKPLETGSLLFLGQTAVDRSLIGREKILGPMDFTERFAALTREHPRVYFKRHPFARDDEAQLAYLDRLPNVERIEHNIYLLLGRDEIVKTAAISSGSLHESRYFGKKTEYLLPPRHDFAGEGAPLTHATSRYVPIFGDYFNPTFWSDVLAPVCATRTCPDIGFTDASNRMRDSFNVFWGFPRRNEPVSQSKR